MKRSNDKGSYTDAHGKFAPGNPGRPRGARHKTTLAIEQLLDGDAVRLTGKAVEMALNGDTTALRHRDRRLGVAASPALRHFDLRPRKTSCHRSLSGPRARDRRSPAEPASSDRGRRQGPELRIRRRRHAGAAEHGSGCRPMATARDLWGGVPCRRPARDDGYPQGGRRRQARRNPDCRERLQLRGFPAPATHEQDGVPIGRGQVSTGGQDRPYDDRRAAPPLQGRRHRGCPDPDRGVHLGDRTRPDRALRRDGSPRTCRAAAGLIDGDGCQRAGILRQRTSC